MNILDIIDGILNLPDTFLGILPEAPDKLIALFEYAGTPPSHFFDTTDYSYNVQVRSRAPRAAEAYQLALQVQGKLNRYNDARLSILQATSIIGIGQDKANPPRSEYTVNFIVAMK